MGWFQTPETTAPCFVLRRTLALLPEFAAALPKGTTAADAIVSPWFAARHFMACPARARKYQFWARRLAGRSFASLTPGERGVVFRVRGLFSLFHQRAWTDHRAGAPDTVPAGTGA